MYFCVSSTLIPWCSVLCLLTLFTESFLSVYAMSCFRFFFFYSTFYTNRLICLYSMWYSVSSLIFLFLLLFLTAIFWLVKNIIFLICKRTGIRISFIGKHCGKIQEKNNNINIYLRLIQGLRMYIVKHQNIYIIFFF